MNEELLYKIKKEYSNDNRWDMYIFEYDEEYFSLEIIYGDNISSSVEPCGNLDLVKSRFKLIPIEQANENEENIDKLYRLFEQELDKVQSYINFKKNKILSMFD